ncbi:nicotinate-nucleotide adenylyltransferase [Rubinisphaera brasiliensis]|uniref:Probable nicotinate-nucleotide adenylyltransferase n=1 Tax=Rubinisphaera brasiliensis (strain ATCC 49424 / DSM 5305 / JCM 21570 / IAM 15109 / NBRC 103401 / IFAM 1448) TaxID=756272 RepID=F0SF79_RUBBR|nr:nicotinate-nucleotide adenylyltransferase [Rubinisphaera brasiliensis]ADY58234.1 nicotinate-nucleotide adenylyltransferase [Rubinisphaera brasiliensis DSM 5305]
MKIGILGGTFDPVHLAHLLLAETCREECGLDQVRLLPASNPPHKQGETISPAKQRIAMLEFAVAGFPEFVVDRREIKRDGLSYTWQTLTEFREEFPEDELFFLMGSDSLRDLMTWKNPETIAELATLVAVNRGPISEEQMNAYLEPLPEVIRKAIRFVQMPAVDISASEIRDRARAGRSLRFLTPRPIERYIVEQGLYRETAE